MIQLHDQTPGSNLRPLDLQSDWLAIVLQGPVT